MIAGMRLDRLAQAYRASHRCELTFDSEVRDWLARRVKTTPQGARFLDGIIAGSIRPVVADHVLDKLGNDQSPGDAVVVLHEDGFMVREGDSTPEPHAEPDAGARRRARRRARPGRT